MHEITIVLFDIDGTLLHTRTAGRNSFRDGLKEVFGHEDDLADVTFAGCTDLGLIREVLASRKLTYSDDQIQAFFTAIETALKKHLLDDDTILYPGVQELLEKLDEHPGVRLGLVTGNVEACAYLKVGHFGFETHFPVGAFGNEHHDRNELASMARKRIEAGLEPDQQITQCFLIGDTPSDIEAARANTMTSIAVTTGTYDRQALEAAGGDHVLNDLSDVEGLLNLFQLSDASR